MASYSVSCFQEFAVTVYMESKIDMFHRVQQECNKGYNVRSAQPENILVDFFTTDYYDSYCM